MTRLDTQQARFAASHADQNWLRTTLGEALDEIDVLRRMPSEEEMARALFGAESNVKLAYIDMIAMRDGERETLQAWATEWTELPESLQDSYREKAQAALQQLGRGEETNATPGEKGPARTGDGQYARPEESERKAEAVGTEELVEAARHTGHLLEQGAEKSPTELHGPMDTKRLADELQAAADALWQATRIIERLTLDGSETTAADARAWVPQGYAAHTAAQVALQKDRGKRGGQA